MKALVVPHHGDRAAQGRAGQHDPAQDPEQVHLHGAGKQVFAADFEPAVSANPYIQFKFKATESGPVVLTWTDDDGSTIVGEEAITVS